MVLAPISLDFVIRIRDKSLSDNSCTLAVYNGSPCSITSLRTARIRKPRRRAARFHHRADPTETSPRDVEGHEQKAPPDLDPCYPSIESPERPPTCLWSAMERNAQTISKLWVMENVIKSVYTKLLGKRWHKQICKCASVQQYCVPNSLLLFWAPPTMSRYIFDSPRGNVCTYILCNHICMCDMSWYKVRHPFSCCEGIVRKPFAGTLWMNQATCSCAKQKHHENPTQDSYIKIIKMERQLTSGLSESLGLFATTDISFTPSINSWHFLQPRPPFRRCTTGVYPNFPSPLGEAMRRASSTYRGSKKFNGSSGSSCHGPMDLWQWGLHHVVPWEQHCVHHSCSGRIGRFRSGGKWLHSKIPWNFSTPTWLLSTSFLSTQETTHPAVRRVSKVAEGLLQTEKRQIFDPQTSTRQARHGMQEGPGLNRGKAMGWPQCWSELVSSWDVLQPSVLHSPVSTAHFHSSFCFWSLPRLSPKGYTGLNYNLRGKLPCCCYGLVLSWAISRIFAGE